MQEIKCKGCQHLFWVSNINFNAIATLRACNKEAVALTREKYRDCKLFFSCQRACIPALHTLPKIKGNSLAEFRPKKSSAGEHKSQQGEAKECWPMLMKELSPRRSTNTKSRRWMVWDTPLSSTSPPPSANPPSLHQKFIFPIRDLSRKYRHFPSPSACKEKTVSLIFSLPAIVSRI